MKTIVKTALTLSLLLPLAGCWDCCSTKKAEEKGQAATHGHTGAKASKCSHKGCTHDHSKDHQKKDSEVTTTPETTTGTINNDMDMDDQVEIQNMNDDDNMNDEDYSA